MSGAANQSPPEVTQEDRDCACAFIDMLGFPQYAAGLVDGKLAFKDFNGEKALEIIARHRLAAEARTRDEIQATLAKNGELIERIHAALSPKAGS